MSVNDEVVEVFKPVLGSFHTGHRIDRGNTLEGIAFSQVGRIRFVNACLELNIPYPVNAEGVTGDFVNFVDTVIFHGVNVGIVYDGSKDIAVGSAVIRHFSQNNVFCTSKVAGGKRIGKNTLPGLVSAAIGSMHDDSLHSP